MSGRAPAVSIAIRAWRRRWLAEAVASVLDQTFADLELVIYDDAGDLEEVARGRVDARVRYVRADQRRQASGRFRAAVAHCRGEYLGVLDDDDRYEPTFVARLVEALERDPGAGVAFCRTTWESADARTAPLDPRPAGRQPAIAPEMLAHGWTVSPSHLLVRRRALEAATQVLPMPDGVAPDVFLNMGVALAGWGHVLVDESLVVCRWHADQLSRTFPASSDTAIATWREMGPLDPHLSALRDRRLARALLVRSMERLARGHVALSRQDLDEAARAAPTAWRTPRRLLRLAAASGRLGSAVVRAWLRHSPRGRRRARPPEVIGDR